MRQVAFRKLLLYVKGKAETKEYVEAYKRSRSTDQGNSDSKSEECEKHSERIIA